MSVIKPPREELLTRGPVQVSSGERTEHTPAREAPDGQGEVALAYDESALVVATVASLVGDVHCNPGQFGIWAIADRNVVLTLVNVEKILNGDDFGTEGRVCLRRMNPDNTGLEWGSSPLATPEWEKTTIVATLPSTPPGNPVPYDPASNWPMFHLLIQPGNTSNTCDTSNTSDGFLVGPVDIRRLPNQNPGFPPSHG